MKRPQVLILLALALVPIAARAQLALYATVDADRRSQSNLFAFPPAGSSNDSSTWLYGPTVGVYYDFIHLGPLVAGVDLRGEFVRGSGYTRNSGLGGVRVAIKPPILPIKPYVQGSLGVAHTNGPGSPTYANNLEYRIAGGLDLTVLPRIDWRILEVGGGSLVNYSFGSGFNQSNSLLSFGTGLVFRVP